MPHFQALLSGLKEASVNTNIGMSQVAVTSLGREVIRLSLKTLRKWDRHSSMYEPFAAEAWEVTAFRQSLDDRPHNCEWANCIRPLSDRASATESCPAAKVLSMVATSSYTRFSVLANLARPSFHMVRSISTPSALKTAEKGKSFSPSETAQPSNQKNCFTTKETESLSSSLARVIKSSKKFDQVSFNILHPSHHKE